jgi:hypothetical protein
MLFDSGKFKLSEPKDMNPRKDRKKQKSSLSPGLKVRTSFVKLHLYRLKRHGLKMQHF